MGPLAKLSSHVTMSAYPGQYAQQYPVAAPVANNGYAPTAAAYPVGAGGNAPVYVNAVPVNAQYMQRPGQVVYVEAEQYNNSGYNNGYGQQRPQNNNSGMAEGLCAGLACCCCLDLLLMS